MKNAYLHITIISLIFFTSWYVVLKEAFKKD